MKNYDILKKKILFTLIAIIVYRIGSHIPLPTVDLAKLNEMTRIAKSGVFSMFNSFSGGAVSRASIFVLGIMPYITSSIIMQLLSASYPPLKRLKKEGGERGVQQISSYTKYLTIIIAFVQGYSLAGGLVSIGVIPQVEPIFAKIFTAFVITVSTVIVMWIGDQITSYGIGNGSSIIIFSGIISEAPKDLAGVFTSIKTGSLTTLDGLTLFLIFACTCGIVALCERTFRMIYIQYPRQNYHQFMAPGHKNVQQNNNFIPLKINTAGVIPPIFANAILLLPTTIISMFSDSTHPLAQWFLANFNHGKLLFILVDIVLIFCFSYFYNTSIFEVDDLTKGLQRNGAFIPGIRPGQQTQDYIKKTLKNLSFIGGVYLSIICAIPECLSNKYGYSFLLGGTGLLIVFSVINDIITQFQSHMISGKYEKVMKKHYSKR